MKLIQHKSALFIFWGPLIDEGIWAVAFKLHALIQPLELANYV